jgi:hypothetical protein
MAAQYEEGTVGYLGADLQLEGKGIKHEKWQRPLLKQDSYRPRDFFVRWHIEASVSNSESAKIASHIIDQWLGYCGRGTEIMKSVGEAISLRLDLAELDKYVGIRESTMMAAIKKRTKPAQHSAKSVIFV